MHAPRKHRKRKGGRPKGSGALRTIDATKQRALTTRELLETRRILQFGSAPDGVTQLFARWRRLCDDVRQLQTDNDKWTRKVLKNFEREKGEAWHSLGVALEKLGDQELSETFATLSKAMRPTANAWQKAAIEKIISRFETDKVRSEGKAPLMTSLRFVSLTASELLAYLRKQGQHSAKEGFFLKHSDSEALHEIRRFVRDTLKVTLRSEQGQRSTWGNSGS